MIMSKLSPRLVETPTSINNDNDYEAFVNSLREQSIGENERVTVPFDGSSRELV